MFAKINNFVGEVITELKKVSWSTRQELIEATWVVIIATAFLGVIIGVADLALSKLVGAMIR